MGHSVCVHRANVGLQTSSVGRVSCLHPGSCWFARRISPLVGVHTEWYASQTAEGKLRSADDVVAQRPYHCSTDSRAHSGTSCASSGSVAGRRTIPRCHPHRRGFGSAQRLPLVLRWKCPQYSPDDIANTFFPQLRVGDASKIGLTAAVPDQGFPLSLINADEPGPLLGIDRHRAHRGHPSTPASPTRASPRRTRRSVAHVGPGRHLIPDHQIAITRHLLESAVRHLAFDDRPDSLIGEWIRGWGGPITEVL